MSVGSLLHYCILPLTPHHQRLTWARRSVETHTQLGCCAFAGAGPGPLCCSALPDLILWARFYPRITSLVKLFLDVPPSASALPFSFELPSGGFL